MPSGTVIRLPDLPTNTRVHRRPGRPRKVMPVLDQDDYTAQINQVRHRHILSNALVRLGPDARTLDVVEAVIGEVAQEVAALAFDADRAESEGRDASQTRGRRIKALLQLAGLVRDREELRREQGVLDGKTLQVAQGHFLAGVSETAADTLPPDIAGAFLAKLKTRFGG
jgi:hypothetical protein